MRLGEKNQDLTELEKAAGRKAARAMRSDFKSALLSTISPREGSKLFRSTSFRAIMKDDALDNITLRTPHYIFKQHYGFEGIKRNGVRMSMKAFGHFDTFFDRTNTLERLATEIGEIRAEEVTANIRF